MKQMTDQPEQVWQPQARPESATLVKQQPEDQHTISTLTTKRSAADRPLTRKQRAFVDHLIENPKSSGTQAARAAYGTPEQEISVGTAQQIAFDNLRKPNVMVELEKHSNNAELTLIEVMGYSRELGKTGTAAGASYASNARQTAQDILDRLHGRATSRTEVRSEAVTLNIDLTGVAGSQPLGVATPQALEPPQE